MADNKSRIKPQINGWLRSIEKNLGFKTDIIWRNVVTITLYHILFIYSVINYAFPVKWQTVLFAFIMYLVGGFGITVGAHRLWCHRSYKAKLPLKIYTLICFASAGHYPLIQWVRDHRVHHKYSDTDADPHSSGRGLFFAHIGWLMMKKHPEVIRCGRQIDMSDLENDPMLLFYEKYFSWFKLMFCYALPMAINVWGLGEGWRTAGAWLLVRHFAILHATFSINSLAHAYGYRPYNKDLKPADNRLMATVTFGEGSHNYHHAFPFDYKAAEFGDFLNFSTISIRMYQKLGLAYDLREATPEMIEAMAARIGDGSHSSQLSAKAVD